MKKLMLPLAMMLAAGVAVAQAETKPADTKSASKAPAAAKAPAHKTHPVEGEVVSADATAKTITVKIAGEDKTVPVHGKAATHLGSLKAGEKVTLTCVDNEKGEHQYVSAIKVNKTSSTAAPAKAKASKKSS
jgi:hypothetical protein